MKVVAHFENLFSVTTLFKSLLNDAVIGFCRAIIFNFDRRTISGMKTIRAKKGIGEIVFHNICLPFSIIHIKCNWH